MSKLKLAFSGRRNVKDENLGPFIRVNLNNGNVKISHDVVEALGLSIGDNINFTELEGTVYVAQEDRGFKIGKGFTTTSGTIAATFSKAFEDKLKDAGVVYVLVDTENPMEATTETDEGEEVDITVYEVTFKSAEKQKANKRRDKGEEAEAEEETEEEELV